MTLFLRNSWYVVALSSEVQRDMLSVRVLGENLVLFRTLEGLPVALEDACPHRKLPLSMGRLLGNDIECGYHGLRFDVHGRCISAPGTREIPRRATVRSYPCVERYGMIWAWMGEEHKMDISKLPQIAEWNKDGWGVNSGDAMDVSCNYLYITDNLLDPSHVSWVHQSSFGNDDIIGHPLQVSVNDAGVTVSRWLRNVEVAPFYKKFVRFSGLCDRKQQYEIRYPTYAIIRAIFVPSGASSENVNDDVGDAKALDHPDVFLMDSYNFLTPVDEKNTRYFWVQLRNFSPNDAEVSRIFNEDVRHAFSEDKAVLEAIQKGLDSNPAKLDLPLDAGPRCFRRNLSKLIEEEQKQLTESLSV